MLDELKQDMQPRRLLTLVTVGVVVSIIDLPQIISLAALIYSGGLAKYAAIGIGMGIFGAIIMQLIMIFFGSARGVIYGPQDSPAAVLSLITAGISAGMVMASDNARLATALAAVIIVSVFTGILFLIVGWFNLNRFIRFIPYPVIGGFIAGTGLLIVKGSIGIMTDTGVTITNLPLLFQTSLLARWIPGLILGFMLLFAARRTSHFLVTPSILILAALGFYVYIGIAGISMDTVRADGWLLGPFPEGALWKPLDPSLLSQVDWGMLASQTSNIITACLLSVMACLLNMSALELILENDLDMRRELTTVGISNVLAGLVGSSAGYHYIGLSGLAARMKVRSNLVGIIASLILTAILLFGGSLLSLIPKFMVGGLLFFLGASFLIEWVIESWSRLPRVDYALVLVILAVVASIGFLEGVGVGLLAAVVIFAVNYSAIDAVKDTLTRATFRSNVERPLEQHQLLETRGEQAYVMRLQGFLFFGTAQALLARVRELFNQSSKEKTRYLLLDFHRVTALDSSAALSFARIHQLTQSNNAHLIFTSVSDDINLKLQRGGLDESANANLHIFPDLDRGMEWCENKMLSEEGSSSIIRSASLRAQLRRRFSPSEVERFMKYLVREEVNAWHTIIHQGDPSDSMFFIESGQVAAYLESAQKQFIRLRSLGAGTIVGEVSMYLHETRTATVTATEKSVLYCLSASALKKMEEKDPDLASRLHQWIAILLSHRVADHNRTIEALLG